MSELRALVWKTLDAAGMLIDDPHFDETRREAVTASKHYFSDLVHMYGIRDLANIAASLNFSREAMARVFAHGWQQAAGLAVLVGVRPNKVPKVAKLGACFNLGIVLLDHLIDTFPERRAALFEHLTPDMLEASSGTRIKFSSDPGIDFVVALAAEIITGARLIGGKPEDLKKLTKLLGQMYRAERASIESPREAEPCTSAVWEVLSAKSKLPSTALAMFALLGNPVASNTTRTTVETAADLVGEALWIVDDLADVLADWDAGCWSRPLLLLNDQLGGTQVSRDEVTRLLLDRGIAAAESKRLADVLTNLGSLAGTSHRVLLRPVLAAVRSWIEEMN